MSTYIKLDASSELQQISTTVGWGDVCRWAFELPDHQFNAIAHLVGYGWEDDLPTLELQLRTAIKKYTPPADVLGTLHGLLDIITKRGESTVAIITDGLVPDISHDEDQKQLTE